MKTENGIPIFGDDDQSGDGEVLSGVIAKDAVQTMIFSLVEMEKEGKNQEQMMELCIWPILYEAAKRFESISGGDLDVPAGGFEYVVG